MNALSFHPLVQADIQAAYDWYEQQRPGLGGEFLVDVEQVLSAISTNPAGYGFAEGDIRAGLARRFPYIIYYRDLGHRIRVLAIYHAARDQAVWQSRE